MADSGSIALIFVVGQAFVFARIGTKLLNLGSATLMYQSIMKVELEKEITNNIEPEEMLSGGETLVFVEPEDIKEEEEE